MRRPLIAVTLTAALALSPWAQAADPQVTDPAGDANFTAEAVDGGMATPVGSQDYADVLSVLWEKVGKDVRVTATFTAAPAPPAGTQLVYRMLGTTEACPFVGVVWYSKKSSDPSIPKAAVRDSCTGETVLTEIAEPKIDGAVMTWLAPLAKFPAAALKAGKLTDLRVEIRELQDYGTQVPSDVPVYGGSYGAANGLVEEAASTNSFSF